MTSAIEMITERLDGDHNDQVCFVNADCANIAYKNEQYRNVIQAADIVFADGFGMKIGGKMLHREIRDNVNGTDMFPLLCEALNGTDKGLFLLGARPGVTDAVKEWVLQKYPDVIISGHHHGYYKQEDELQIIKMIKDSGASLLLVAFGAPRQDIWISQQIAETGVDIAIGVGGLFDFFSGQMPRAPLWMRRIGMEWVYRLIQEPGRMWKRYLIGNGLFLFRVFKEKLRS